MFNALRSPPAGTQKPEAVLAGRALPEFANDVFRLQKVDGECSWRVLCWRPGASCPLAPSLKEAALMQ